MPKLSIQAGLTSQSVNIFIADSSSTTGAGLTGLAYNTASLVAYYSHAGANATATQINLATLSTITTAWSSGGFKEIDATNMPGWYRLDLPDAVLATSKGRSVAVHLKGAANMAPLPLEIELTGWNNQDSVRGGLTAMPNVSSGSAGALLVDGTGTAAISTSGGRAKADVSYWNASAVATPDTAGYPKVTVKNGTGIGELSLNSGAVSLHTSQPAVTFTSLTSTGALTVSDGFIITCSTSGRSAIQATGNGTGHGIIAKSGSGGATGSGIYAQSQATAGHGIIGVATGTTGNGIYGYGGTSAGNGIKGQGGDSGGYGIEATAASGAAIHAQSSSGYGFEVVAGGTNMSAVKLTPTGTGYGINGTIASVVALGTGAITTSSFAAGAINAAAIADDAIDGGSVAASAVTKIQAGLSTLTTADIPTEAEIDAVLSLAHGAGNWLTATGFAVAGDAMTLTTAERGSVADKILSRNINGGGDGTRTVEEALAVLRNKSAISGGTLTVYDTDDATSLWTATVTSSASADPITGVDPA